jgi:hypothetical protein
MVIEKDSISEINKNFWLDETVYYSNSRCERLCCCIIYLLKFHIANELYVSIRGIKTHLEKGGLVRRGEVDCGG